MRIKVRLGRARKAFVAPDPVTPAHEDYKAAELFADLLSLEKGIGIYDCGESVAVLLGNSETCRIVYGKVYGTTYSDRLGIAYHVITRDGTKHTGNMPRNLVRI